MTTEETNPEQAAMDEVLAYDRTVSVGAADAILALFGNAPTFEIDVNDFQEFWDECDGLTMQQIWEEKLSVAIDAASKRDDDKILDRVPEVPERLTRIEAVVMLGDARNFAKEEAQADQAAQN